MIVVPAGVKVHLALGYTDMRKGLDGLATLIQEHLKKDSGHLFVFRGKNASLLKILFWDGTGLCLFTKRIDRATFMWPRAPERFWRPLNLRWVGNTSRTKPGVSGGRFKSRRGAEVDSESANTVATIVLVKTLSGTGSSSLLARTLHASLRNTRGIAPGEAQ